MEQVLKHEGGLLTSQDLHKSQPLQHQLCTLKKSWWRCWVSVSLRRKKKHYLPKMDPSAALYLLIKEQTSDAVGPTLMLQLHIGVPVEAIVDTGSQSTVISWAVLRQVGRHLHHQGREMPQLRLPSARLHGKDCEGEKLELDIAAKYPWRLKQKEKLWQLRCLSSQRVSNLAYWAWILHQHFDLSSSMPMGYLERSTPVIQDNVKSKQVQLCAWYKLQHCLEGKGDFWKLPQSNH